MNNKKVKNRMAVGEGVIDCSLNSPAGQKIGSSFRKISRNGFSLAEAMIVVLIGAIALGMSAPMISRQLRNETLTNTQMQIIQRQIDELRTNRTNAPSGAIMFFEQRCPDRWTDMSGEYAGRYIRIDGEYDVCDKRGENAATGECVAVKSTATLSAGMTQGESNRRVLGTFPGNDAETNNYTGNLPYTASNFRDGYVEKLHNHGFLSGAFDYVKTSELPGRSKDAGYDIPSNWSTLLWANLSTEPMYKTDNSYVYFIDPAVFSFVHTDATASGRFYLNSIDTKRVLPTDTTNDETRPKTVVLKACKAP